MSRQLQDYRCACFRFPRVSGDEPELQVHVPELPVFSPRERG